MSGFEGSTGGGGGAGTYGRVPCGYFNVSVYTSPDGLTWTHLSSAVMDAGAQAWDYTANLATYGPASEPVDAGGSPAMAETAYGAATPTPGQVVAGGQYFVDAFITDSGATETLGLAYGLSPPSLIVGLGIASANFWTTSSDGGQTWQWGGTLPFQPAGNGNPITWDPTHGVFLAAANGSVNTSFPRLWSSSNGTTWTSVATPIDSGTTSQVFSQVLHGDGGTVWPTFFGGYKVLGGASATTQYYTTDLSTWNTFSLPGSSGFTSNYGFAFWSGTEWVFFRFYEDSAGTNYSFTYTTPHLSSAWTLVNSTVGALATPPSQGCGWNGSQTLFGGTNSSQGGTIISTTDLGATWTEASPMAGFVATGPYAYAPQVWGWFKWMSALSLWFAVLEFTNTFGDGICPETWEVGILAW